MQRALSVTTLLALLLLCGCEEETSELFVELRTDYVAVEEVRTARTVVRLDDATSVVRDLETGLIAGDLVDGQRIAELSGIAKGRYIVDVSLIGIVGEIVATRRAIVEVRANTGLTVIMTRDCAGVTCPGASDPATASVCLGGRCASPECTPENPTACPSPSCVADVDCPAGPAACSEGACLEGTCAVRSVDARCADGEYCQPQLGCLVRGAAPADAGLDASDASDAADASDSADVGVPSTCDWTVPFTFEDVTSFDVVNSPMDEQEMWISPDQLYLTFARTGPGVSMLESRRASTAVSFPAPTPLTGTLNPSTTIRVALSADGLRAYVCSDSGRPDFDIQVAVRADPASPFVGPLLPLSLTTDMNDWDPFEAASGLEIYFAPQPSDDSGPGRLQVATRTSIAEPFGPALPLDLTTGMSEGNPSLTADDLVLTWNAAGELLYATRPDVSSPFVFRGDLPGLNTADGESEPQVSADGCELWFSSDRPGGMGADDYYHAVYRAL